MNQRKPLEFVNSVPVTLNAFSKLNAAELHHIFPQAYLKKAKSEFYGLKDSIINIALAGSGLNKKYRDFAPSVYIEKCAKKNKRFKDSLQSHFIDDYQDSGLIQDDYEIFLHYRARNILNEIKAKVGLLSETEEIFQSNEKEAIDTFEKQMRMLIDKVLLEESPHYWKQLSKEILSSVEPRIKKWLKSNPDEDTR